LPNNLFRDFSLCFLCLPICVLFLCIESNLLSPVSIQTHATHATQALALRAMRALRKQKTQATQALALATMIGYFDRAFLLASVYVRCVKNLTQ